MAAVRAALDRGRGHGAPAAGTGTQGRSRPAAFLATLTSSQSISRAICPICGYQTK